MLAPFASRAWTQLFKTEESCAIGAWESMVIVPILRIFTRETPAALTNYLMA
jgi:hypothetical protein